MDLQRGKERRVSNLPTGDQQPPPASAALHALIDQAPDAIFVADRDGRYLYVNEAGCRMLGYERGELVGLTILQTIAPEHAGRLERSRAAMLEGRTQTAEWLLRRKDGSPVPVEVNARILPDGQWQGFVRDISERKAHEAERLALFDEIATERRRLQTLLDTLPLGLVFFEPGGRISANRRAEELLGMSMAPEGSAQYADRIFHPDGRRVPPEALPGPRVRRGETILGEEYVVRRPDGSELPVLASAAPIRDKEGTVVGGVSVFQDISERMRLEQSVRDNERLLKAVFDIIPVGIWISDRSQRIVSHNPAAERIWCGARYLEVARFGEYKGWWADSGKPVAAGEWPLARAMVQGETCPGRLIRIQCHDGSFKTIIDAAAPLRDEHGNLTGAVAVNEDITALHEAQERLRASEELFRTVFDLLPVGLWIADRDGRVTRGNPAGHRIWQGAGEMGPEHYGRQQGWSVETGKPIAPEEWGIPRAIRRGEATSRDVIRIQCFDGSFKTVINWAAPIRSDSGEITGAVAINEDITALHHTQEQLRTAVRDREDILAVVTHDLRSPLSAIMTLATTIGVKSHKLSGGGPVQALADNLVEIARQMFGLVNDLLAVALVRSDHSVLKTTPTRASALLEKAARVSRPLFAREAIRFHVQAVGDLPVIHVDTDRILRVFNNLLDNALKFTLAQGEVVLRAEAQSGGVRYCVANSGPALSQAELDSMFQPFWQAGRGDLRGAGLGLSICRSIVEAHGGTIWAEPAAGKRVRICFFLPRANPVTFAPAKG